MCKHEYTKGFKFCPYCGEELPQVEKPNPATGTTVDEWGATHVSFIEPVIDMYSSNIIDGKYRKARYSCSEYIEKLCHGGLRKTLQNMIEICNYLASEQRPTINGTDFFTFRQIEANKVVSANSLIAAGIIYPVGTVNYGKIIDNENTFDEEVKLYAFNQKAKARIVNAITATIFVSRTKAEKLIAKVNELEKIITY